MPPRLAGSRYPRARAASWRRTPRAPRARGPREPGTGSVRASRVERSSGCIAGLVSASRPKTRTETVPRGSVEAASTIIPLYTPGGWVAGRTITVTRTVRPADDPTVTSADGRRLMALGPRAHERRAGPRDRGEPRGSPPFGAPRRRRPRAAPGARAAAERRLSARADTGGAGLGSDAPGRAPTGGGHPFSRSCRPSASTSRTRGRRSPSRTASPAGRAAACRPGARCGAPEAGRRRGGDLTPGPRSAPAARSRR